MCTNPSSLSHHALDHGILLYGARAFHLSGAVTSDAAAFNLLVRKRHAELQEALRKGSVGLFAPPVFLPTPIDIYAACNALAGATQLPIIAGTQPPGEGATNPRVDFALGWTPKWAMGMAQGSSVAGGATLVGGGTAAQGSAHAISPEERAAIKRAARAQKQRDNRARKKFDHLENLRKAKRRAAVQRCREKARKARRDAFEMLGR